MLGLLVMSVIMWWLSIIQLLCTTLLFFAVFVWLLLIYFRLFYLFSLLFTCCCCKDKIYRSAWEFASTVLYFSPSFSLWAFYFYDDGLSLFLLPFVAGMVFAGGYLSLLILVPLILFTTLCSCFLSMSSLSCNRSFILCPYFLDRAVLLLFEFYFTV